MKSLKFAFLFVVGLCSFHSIASAEFVKAHMYTNIFFVDGNIIVEVCWDISFDGIDGLDGEPDVCFVYINGRYSHWSQIRRTKEMVAGIDFYKEFDVIWDKSHIRLSIPEIYQKNGINILLYDYSGTIISNSNHYSVNSQIHLTNELKHGLYFISVIYQNRLVFHDKILIEN